jgi:ribosomal subunit interface protein
MNINLRFSNADLSELLSRYIDRRLRFALGHFRERVGEVFVTVDGIAGRAGESKCHMSVKLLPFGELTVQERGPDLFEAIDRAAGRLGRRFGRELDRFQRAKQKRESVRLAT